MKLLHRNYLIAAFFLAILVISSALFLHYILNSKEHDARVINIAGRQRMLSQKISKTSLEIEHSNGVERTNVSKELEEALILFENSQDALEFGSAILEIEPKNYSPDIILSYATLRPTHEELIREGYALLNASRINDIESIQIANTQIQEKEDYFLKNMNDIVFAHDEEAENKLILSISTIYILASIIVISIIGTWLILIRPTLKRSQRIEHDKATFIKLASHQLRTPLSSVNWFIEMLKEEGKLNKNQAEYIEEISIGARRMKEVVNSLIVFSSLDEKKVEGEFSLKKIIEQSLAKYENIIKEKDLQIHQNVPETPLTYTADESKLLYVIDTLIDNAIHYTRAKDLIVITLEQKSKEIIFSVRDTGIGIPESEHEHIGTTFFRAKNATQIDHDGTGINLKISKKIAESLGGSLTFKSRENAGSTFVVRLPVK